MQHKSPQQQLATLRASSCEAWRVVGVAFSLQSPVGHSLYCRTQFRCLSIKLATGATVAFGDLGNMCVCVCRAFGGVVLMAVRAGVVFGVRMSATDSARGSLEPRITSLRLLPDGRVATLFSLRQRFWPRISCQHRHLVTLAMLPRSPSLTSAILPRSPNSVVSNGGHLLKRGVVLNHITHAAAYFALTHKHPRRAHVHCKSHFELSAPQAVGVRLHIARGKMHGAGATAASVDMALEA